MSTLQNVLPTSVGPSTVSNVNRQGTLPTSNKGTLPTSNQGTLPNINPVNVTPANAEVNLTPINTVVSLIPKEVIPGLKDVKDNTDVKDFIPPNTIANIQNPVNILQQERSKITTNPFIPNEQKMMEFQTIDRESNEIIKKAYEKNNIYNFSIKQINENISKSTIGFLDDLFIKPENNNWIEYIQIILLKEERYVYLGFLLIMFVVLVMFIE